MSAPNTEELAQEREELVKEREEAADQREGALRIPEEAVGKADKQTEPIRASAAWSSTDIHKLPDEILENIFALLNVHMIVQVLSVCRRWLGVIEDRNVIKKLKFEGDTFTTEDALSLIDSAPGLKSLELIRRSDTVALLDAVSARCTNLLHLSVDSCNESISLTEALGKVFQANPRITDLRLSYSSASEDLRFYQELGSLLPDLRKLELDIRQLSDVKVGTLLDSCSRNQMEEFKALSNCCRDEHVAKVVQYWGRSLRVLELYAFKLTNAALGRLANCSELRRLGLQMSAPGDWLRRLAALSHLEELLIALSREGNSENWWVFFSQSRSGHALRKISFQGRSGVDDSVLASVAAFCPQLEELAVTGIYVTISGVREVLRGCRKVQDLHIHTIDPRVGQIVPELPQLAPQLRRIRLGNHAMRALGEETLKDVQAQMPHLRIE